MGDPCTGSELRCPWCDYNLTALTSDVCPECGRRFVIAKPSLVSTLRYRSFRLTMSDRMVCPECGHANTAFMPARCRHCGTRFSLYQRVFGTSP